MRVKIFTRANFIYTSFLFVHVGYQATAKRAVKILESLARVRDSVYSRERERQYTAT